MGRKESNQTKKIKCWLSGLHTGFLKILSGIANTEDPDQTASSEAVWSESELFVCMYTFLAGN